MRTFEGILQSDTSNSVGNTIATGTVKSQEQIAPDQRMNVNTGHSLNGDPERASLK